MLIEDDAAASQPSALLNSSTISINRPSPKQLYFDKVAAEENEVLREALKSLYDFGFINFSANKVLMLKYKDVNQVANQLLTGALSESQFQGMMEWNLRKKKLKEANKWKMTKNKKLNQ